MNQIPRKIKAEILLDPFYKTCARKGLHGHVCSGRITWEHVVIYAGKQVQAKWAIIPLCEKAHSVDNWQDRGDLNKEINLWIALNRATDLELREASKATNYIHKRYYLNTKYGVYHVNIEGIKSGKDVGINYDILSPSLPYVDN